MKNCFLSLFLLSFFASCTKENSAVEQQQSVTDPIPQFAMSAAKLKSANQFLKREVTYIKTNPLLKNIRLFSYDAANRCTEIKTGSIDSSVTNPVFSLKQTLTFNYSTSNSLLPASVSLVRAVFPNLVTTFYYTYNNQDRKIKDSVRVKNMAGEPADRVIHYEYDNDRVYVTPVLKGFPMENNGLDTLSLLKGGNILKALTRHLRSSGDLMISYTFTYDQAINPYNSLNIANSLYFESPSLGIAYNVPKETHFMGVTTNNMTSWTSVTYTVRFSYLYNTNKYPVRKEMYLPGETDPIQVTLFEY